MSKGFFYSRNYDLIKKLSEYLYWKRQKYDYLDVYDYEFRNDKLRISASDNNYAQWFWEFVDFNEINDFINNPELTKKIKNYRIRKTTYSYT